MNRKRFYIFAVLLLTINILVYGQKSAEYQYADNNFNKGISLYEKAKYSAARNEFEQVIEMTEGLETQIRAEAMYHYAMCAINLYNNDAEYQVFRFLEENPESPHVNDICFRLGNKFYYSSIWFKAILWYNKVDRHKLSQEDLAQYFFKRGYSYYSRKDFVNARVDFYEILETDSPYTSPATYYYSHIHYVEENYQTALNGFKEIDDDPLFSGIAPYYISQILYMQKKYDEVIDYAPSFMEKVSPKRLGEMAKILGESYFELEQYAEAIPYLEQYKENTRGYSIKDRYQMAFAYYKSEAYKKAANLFETISYRKTEIAQSALYHLADCYLHLDDKNRARIAFSQASKMDYDQRIQEDALFNYAKLTFELSYNPFNEAIIGFNMYIKYYPSSSRIDEVYNYLVTAYLQTKNYSMALESLEKIKYKDEKIEAAYQKVAFYRGLELYNNLRFIEAVDIFDRSLEYGKYDAAIKARTYYWLGEAAYRSDDMEMANMYFNEFLQDPVSYRLKEYALGHYSMAYVHFDKEEYDVAENWFTTYVRLEKNSAARTKSDAYNRLGDCRFVQEDYWRAIEEYNESIKLGKLDRDYALFQKGFTYGILNSLEQKLEVMKKIITEMPTSPFVDDALFEAGRTYVALENSSEAIRSYERIVSEHPNSSYLSKALNQLGLIQFNSANYDDALVFYAKVAKNYPGTTEADNALQSLETIYVKKNNVDAYLVFINELGRDISNKQQDSLMYVAAESAYTNGDCVSAVESLDKYLSKHPNGNYLLNAHYYKADCDLKLNRKDDAVLSLEYIISQPRNMFSEPALVAASAIYYDQGKYSKAVNNYLHLLEVAEEQSNISDAIVGVMRCYYRLEEYSNTIKSASDVLNIEKLRAEVKREAWFNIAKSYFAINNIDMALEYFRKNAVEVNSIEGAESKYRVAEILYDRGEYTNAEEEIYDFIEKNTPHQYWMGKAFLLLSDVYISMDDEFQAIHTLKSIIDYYNISDDGIVDEAKRRHDNLTDEVDNQIPDDTENGTDSL